MLLEQRQRLLKGAPARTSRIVDEWVIAQYSGGDGLLSCTCMGHWEHGNIGLGEEGGHFKRLCGVAVPQYTGIEGSVLQTLSDSRRKQSDVNEPGGRPRDRL